MFCIFFKEEGCDNCVFDRIGESENDFVLSSYWTNWSNIKRFSGKPSNRYMGHTGPVTVCPAKGPNYKGAVPSLIP